MIYRLKKRRGRLSARRVHLGSVKVKDGLLVWGLLMAKERNGGMRKWEGEMEKVTYGFSCGGECHGED